MTRTWMRISVLSLTLAAMLAGMAGCGWMGRTAGKAQAAVENGVEAMNQGYKHGYDQKRAKDAPNGQENPASGQGSTDTNASGNAI